MSLWSQLILSLWLLASGHDGRKGSTGLHGALHPEVIMSLSAKGDIEEEARKRVMRKDFGSSAEEQAEGRRQKKKRRQKKQEDAAEETEDTKDSSEMVTEAPSDEEMVTEAPSDEELVTEAPSGENEALGPELEADANSKVADAAASTSVAPDADTDVAASTETPEVSTDAKGSSTEAPEVSSDAASASTEVPTEQAQIQIEAELSTGRCSAVLLGKDRSGGPAAVKALSLKTAKILGIDERCLWGQVQVMREVQHPNLVRLVDAMVSWEPLPFVKAEPPFLCIVMEYLANAEPLSQRIRQCIPHMPIQLVERILLQLASALARLHRSDVVHRDVWRENILIEKQSDKVTLLDLGCAERLHKPMLNKMLNIPYMSPEAAAGLPQDVSDDAWALGLLVTEMVTGRFVADRLGRVDMPIHSHPALAQALAETMQRAHDLGLLATQLLDVASRRPKMAEVVNLLRPGHRRDTEPERRIVPREKKIQVRAAGGPSPVRPTSPLGFRGRLCTSQRLSRHAVTHVDVSPGRFGRISSTSKSQASQNSLGSTATGSPVEPAAFQPGQTVLYCPREAGVQKATVLGRVDGRGWQIQLENGLCRMVEDAEEWRLCLCDLPQPPRPPPAEGPVLAWAEVRQAPMGKVLSTSSTVSSLATALTGSTAATEAVEAPRSGPKVVSKSYTMWTSTSPMRPAKRASPGGNTGASAASLRPFVAKSPPSDAHLGPMLRARPLGLFPGQRLFYTARSNGQRYAGVLTGLLPSGGYRIFLDCGETKVVEENEAWRLAF